MRVLFVAMSLIWSATMLQAQSVSSETEQKNAPAVFVLQDGEESLAFNREAWMTAAKQESGKILEMFLYDEPEVFQRAAEVARAAGADDNIIILATSNISAKNSTEFAKMKTSMDQVMLEQNADLNWRTAFEYPMCVLYERAPLADEPAPFAVLGVMKQSHAQYFCYRMAMTYYASQQDPEGNRTPPVYVDAQTITMQEMMPPIAIRSAYLAHKDQRDEKGRYLKRESNVYAVNEEIFLRAYLENVARELPGTMLMRFNFDLEMEVRDQEGNSSDRFKLYTYEGPSRLLYPVDRTQFWSDITAGVALQDPGSYELRFIFTNKARGDEPPAEVSFPIIVEAADSQDAGD